MQRKKSNTDCVPPYFCHFPLGSQSRPSRVITLSRDEDGGGRDRGVLEKAGMEKRARGWTGWCVLQTASREGQEGRAGEQSPAVVVEKAAVLSGYSVRF